MPFTACPSALFAATMENFWCVSIGGTCSKSLIYQLYDTAPPRYTPEKNIASVCSGDPSRVVRLHSTWQQGSSRTLSVQHEDICQYVMKNQTHGLLINHALVTSCTHRLLLCCCAGSHAGLKPSQLCIDSELTSWHLHSGTSRC